jgi:carbamoyltransferase
MPRAKALTRLHTVDALSAPPRFGRLLSRFTELTGCPFLFNTSFNGFHEPIVCDPRDAVRVFYGTGLDLLVMGQFVLTK